MHVLRAAGQHGGGSCSPPRPMLSKSITLSVCHAVVLSCCHFRIIFLVRPCSPTSMHTSSLTFSCSKALVRPCSHALNILMFYSRPRALSLNAHDDAMPSSCSHIGSSFFSSSFSFLGPSSTNLVETPAHVRTYHDLLYSRSSVTLPAAVRCFTGPVYHGSNPGNTPYVR